MGGVSTEDRLLRARISWVLTEMQTVSEGIPAHDYRKVKVTVSKSHGSPPTGARLDADDGDGPPPKGQSLYFHWRYRLAHADSTRERWMLCFLAERDLMNERHSTGTGDRRSVFESKDDRDTRIIEQYKGMTAEEAAVFEETNSMNIRRVRERKGQDPITGYPLSKVGSITRAA